MGVFIKFACNTCGEYKCDCPPDLKNRIKLFTFKYIDKYYKDWSQTSIPVQTGSGVGTDYTVAINDFYNKLNINREDVVVLDHKVS